MNIKQLKEEINRELEEIKICLDEIEQDSTLLTIQKQDTLKCRRLTQAVALNMHGLYTGTERIFENISKTIDNKPIGKSAKWHSDLLNRMREKIAQQIINEFPAGEPLAIVKIKQVISQSDHALYLKQTKDKVEVNKYLNTIISKATKFSPGDKSQSKSSELD